MPGLILWSDLWSNPGKGKAARESDESGMRARKPDLCFTFQGQILGQARLEKP